MKKFRKGDEVIIISGSNKGKIGKLLSFSGSDKVIVDGVNLATIHKKPTSAEAGKVIKSEKPIHISNISHVEDGKAVKIGFLIDNGEKKAFSGKNRISKKTKNKISN